MSSHDTAPDTASSSDRIAFVAESALVLVYLAACVAGPFVVLAWAGPAWAAVAGLALPLSWVLVMPTTCQGGGLIWSLIGLNMFLLLVGWSVLGAVLLVRAVL